MTDRPPISELSSWKEIANHLQVSVRTAQLWEKQRGLPVRRVPGGRGRVYLRLDELEEWLQEQPKPSEDERSESDAGTSARMPRGVSALVATLLALLAIAALSGGLDAILPSGAGTGIDSLRFDDGAVVGLDEDGEVLWQFPLAERPDLGAYRNDLHLLQQEDVDGDGIAEVLVPIVPENSGEPSALVCLEPDGTKRWRFELGAALRTRALDFEPIFRPRNFGVVRTRSGSRGLVVVSNHNVNYPTQVVMLDPSDGRPLSEYWHPGHIGVDPPQFLIDDLDTDGADEVYLTGINNARELATLVVLDPIEMSGAAREDHSDYRFEGIPPARERARIFFPQSLVSRERSDRYNRAQRILAGPGLLHVGVSETIGLEAAATLDYSFDFDLAPRQVSLSDIYISLFDQLREAGVHDRSSAQERRWLLERIEVVRPGGATEPDGG